MKTRAIRLILAAVAVTSCLAGGVTAQTGKQPAAKPGKNIVFAVINDGTTLEPIAYVNSGKLEEPVNGGGEPAELGAFARTYLRKGSVYDLVFGGAKGGTVSVKSSNPKMECGKNTAVAITKALKTPLKGYVMGLATSAPIKSTEPFRRKPTAAEKEEADTLAKSEFAKHKITPKVLRYHNLTAMDLDNDGVAELVGSYWVEVDKLTRGLLFMIAAKGTNAKYSVGYQEYQSVDQEKVMSNAIKDVDDGVGHEVLLDVFDFDGDGVANIFTYKPSFEGAAFYAYSKSGNKWVRSYEFSNYHCAY
jgi:hypothetical protein